MNKCGLSFLEQHVDDTFSRWTQNLRDLIRIESISFAGYPPRTLSDAADFCKHLLYQAGFEKVMSLSIDNAPPYVYAESIRDLKAPTVLLYAHYDVQPPLHRQNWLSPPFEAVEKDGRLYGRGSADDKAGIILHTAASEVILRNLKDLPLNLKVLFEGEEETGSPNMSNFLSAYSALLKSDILIVADSTNFDSGMPSLTTSLRGLVALELEVSSLRNPLHSGLWGGAIPDPVQELAKILASLTDQRGNIQIPELYQMIKSVDNDTLESVKNLPLDEKQFRKQSGLLDEVPLLCDPKDIWLKTWKEPSLIVNSIESGSKKLAGNVIMNSAWCRIGIRTVPDMKAVTVLKLLKQKIKENASPHVHIKMRDDALTDAWTCSPKSFSRIPILAALEEGYKKKPVLIGSGGSIPFVKMFESQFPELSILLTGIEDPYSKVHAENESLLLSDLKKAILSEVIFFSKLKKE